jgi:hypothetical protein
MKEDPKQADTLGPEIHEVMRNLVTAVRAVKLYPPNNPVYSQSVKKAADVLHHFLETTPKYSMGVRKGYFTYLNTPAGKDAQLNKAIAQDLFAKGIREIAFSEGVTGEELLVLCQSLALSSEELAMKSGIASILWQKGATHISITEAGLEEVITTSTEEGWEDKAVAGTPAGILDPSTAKKEITVAGRTLVLGDLMNDPAGFSAGMVELAKQTKGEHESVDDRLFALYQDAGRKIQEENPGESDTLFEGLAKSALALEPPFRDALILSKLYGGLDSESVGEQKSDLVEEVPNELHEILTGRFSKAWTVQQVATLLKKTSTKKSAPPPAQPSPPSTIVAVPLPQDLVEIAKDIADYSPDEMAALESLGKSGMESDIIEAAVRTLIFLLPIVKNPHQSLPEEKEAALFSGVVHQLEDMQSYLLKKKDYDRATLIIRALHMPVDPVFKPRMMEAIRKTSSKAVIIAAIHDMRKLPRDSPEYLSAYAFLFALERQATEVLLELLAEENDRDERIFLLDLVKDVGKNQTALFAEHLSDGRWYFVRNIVSILGESKTDQAIAFLRKAADHENVRIRQEVIKGLISIGGKKASSVLAKFLRDKDADIQVTAIRAMADFPGIGAEESQPLVVFLEDRPLKKKEQALTLEAIKALGKIGGPEAGEFLKRYTSIRWWKSRKLQAELRDTARRAMEEIMRRQGDGGRARR